VPLLYLLYAATAKDKSRHLQTQAMEVAHMERMGNHRKVLVCSLGRIVRERHWSSFG